MSGVLRASYAPPGYLLFVRDSNLIAQPFDAQRLELSGEPLVLAAHVDADEDYNTSDFSVSGNGVLAWRTHAPAIVEGRQLAWFDRTGKQLPGLDAREPYAGSSLSPDGNRIAVIKSDAGLRVGIWLLDLVRGSASRFTFGLHDPSSPVWSPNGRRIVFSRFEPPTSNLYWKDASGAGNEELLLTFTEPSGISPTDWSRDGRFILFEREGTDAYGDIWVLPLTGDRKPVPVLQTEFNERAGAFSPDGRWIAYVSNETGRNEIYVRSFNEAAPGATAGKWPVSTAGGDIPKWRRDGKELFYLAPDGKLMAVPVKAGSTFEPGVTAAGKGALAQSSRRDPILHKRRAPFVHLLA